MRREKQEHHTTSGTIQEKLSREKQHEKMLDGLTKWIKIEHMKMQ